MNDAEHRIRAALLAMADDSYRSFMLPLIPSVSPDAVIGIRTPVLRRYARALAKTPDAAVFLTCLPHRYFEENNLHAHLIEHIRDLDTCVAALDAFLPHIDNWATCDSLSPPVLAKHPERLRCKIGEWLTSPYVYAVRFAVVMLMKHFLDEKFSTGDLAAVAALPTEQYYLHMAVAWYFATALAKQYDAALPYLTEQRLDMKTHNKTIQKALESYRITAEQKTYLRTLRIK